MIAEPRFDRRHTPARRNEDIIEKLSQLDQPGWTA